MRLFRRTYKTVDPRQEELAGSIAGKIIKWQTVVANYLNGKTRHLSPKAGFVLLMVFCLLFAAFNVYLLIRSINY